VGCEWRAGGQVAEKRGRSGASGGGTPPCCAAHPVPRQRLSANARVPCCTPLRAPLHPIACPAASHCVSSANKHQRPPCGPCPCRLLHPPIGHRAPLPRSLLLRLAAPPACCFGGLRSASAGQGGAGHCAGALVGCHAVHISCLEPGLCRPAPSFATPNAPSPSPPPRPPDGTRLHASASCASRRCERYSPIKPSAYARAPSSCSPATLPGAAARRPASVCWSLQRSHASTCGRKRDQPKRGVVPASPGPRGCCQAFAPSPIHVVDAVQPKATQLQRAPGRQHPLRLPAAAAAAAAASSAPLPSRLTLASLKR
jgi:hypothetical protein